MATNLAIDDRLIEEARDAGRPRTKKEAAALEEYVKRHRQQRILELTGQTSMVPEQRPARSVCLASPSHRCLAWCR